tara:strand:+ start:52 stop:258 length:207 start_codon:yes stop_codon:yes gene_type:complete
MTMVYSSHKDVLDFLKTLEENDDNRLGDTVTVWDMEMGEYFPANLLTIEGGDGIMEDGQMFFAFNFDS